MSAETTAQALLTHVVGPFGMFKSILTDQGPNFESNLIKQLCKLMDIQKLHTTTYHPPCNGGTERTNKTIKPNLAKYVNDEHSNWDEYLALAVSSYNAAVHSTTGISPFEALFARPPVNAADIILASRIGSEVLDKSMNEFIKQLKEKAMKINNLIENNTAIAQERQKYGYDKDMTKLIQYKPGDFVKIKNFRARLNHSKSLEPKFLGPFKILRILGDLNYELVNENGKLEKVHYNRMYVYKTTDEFKFSVKTKLVKSKIKVNENRINEVEDKEFVVIPIIRKSLRLKQLKRTTEAERYQRFLELEQILPHEPIENANNDGLTIDNNVLHGLHVNAWINDLNNDWLNEVINQSHTLHEQEIQNELNNNNQYEQNDLDLTHLSGTTDQSFWDQFNEENTDWSINMTNNSADEDIPVNEHNKRLVKCYVCNNMFEEKYGLGVHLRTKQQVQYQMINNIDVDVQRGNNNEVDDTLQNQQEEDTILTEDEVENEVRNVFLTEQDGEGCS